MNWRRTTMGQLEYDLGVYRGVVERTTQQTTWTARVEARTETHTSVYDYATMHEAQPWVEWKIEALLRQPPAPR
jgi:hypothetical protein